MKICRKRVVFLFLVSVLLSSSVFAGTTFMASGSAKQYEITTTQKATGGDISLFDYQYLVRMESKYFGSLKYSKTFAEYDNKNFNEVDYKSSVLMYYTDPMAIMILPSYNLKKFDEPNRKYKEQTVSIWLGLFSYSQREDENSSSIIKSKRYGLTTSKFAEEYRHLISYGFRNADDISEGLLADRVVQLENNLCSSAFWYSGGYQYCSFDDFNMYAYYGLSYDYYAIDVEHDIYGEGRGTGFMYGANALLELSYNPFENNSIVFGIDYSYFVGTETIDFETVEFQDDVSRKNFATSFKYVGRF